MREDAARRQHATRFGALASEPAGVGSGSGESPEPLGRNALESRVQAARFVTNRDSHQQLERIVEMERIAADRNQPAAVREVAEDELDHIRNGGPVDLGWQRVRAAAAFEAQLHPGEPEPDLAAHDVLAAAKRDRARRIKENRQKRAAAAASAHRSMRSFTLTWSELAGWTKRYDPEQAARQLSDDDWTLFLSVVAETNAFAESATRERERPHPRGPT